MAGAAAPLPQPYDCCPPAAASITFSLPFPSTGNSLHEAKSHDWKPSRVIRSLLKADGIREMPSVCGVCPSGTFPDL